jgi:mannose-1-phosphate guanylyltransferase/mannose-6-phosphate isomerase
MNRRSIALLLVGGAGTRLWPCSTERRPKQFLKLFGERSLFQLTIERLRDAGCTDIVVVSNAILQSSIRADIEELGISIPPVVIEPARRDSAAAIAAATVYARERWGEDAILGVFPGDDLFADKGDFTQALQDGAKLASAGWLVTFGIRPTAPTTAYGYIERGQALAEHPPACAVAKFHEKPNEETAQAYLDSGGYDWNSGMFLFSAKRFAEEAEAHMPDIWSSAQTAVRAGRRIGDGLSLNPEAFMQARKTSVDYALFEKSERVAVLPVGFEWSDVGDWSAVYESLEKNANGNVILGDVTLQDCSGTLAVGEGTALVISGLRDMVVISTAEGAFMAPRARAADVKKLIAG